MFLGTDKFREILYEIIHVRYLKLKFKDNFCFFYSSLNILLFNIIKIRENINYVQNYICISDVVLITDSLINLKTIFCQEKCQKRRSIFINFQLLPLYISITKS